MTMFSGIKHRGFTIDYVEPTPVSEALKESTFRATCDNCGQHVDANVSWQRLRGAIDELVITDALRGAISKHEKQHAI